MVRLVVGVLVCWCVGVLQVSCRRVQNGIPGNMFLTLRLLVFCSRLHRAPLANTPCVADTPTPFCKQ